MAAGAAACSIRRGSDAAATWVSPRAQPADAAGLLADLGVATSTVFVAQAVHGSAGGDPLRAWDLDDLRAGYDAFVAEFGPLLDRVRDGRVRARPRRWSPGPGSWTCGAPRPRSRAPRGRPARRLAPHLR